MKTIPEPPQSVGLRDRRPYLRLATGGLASALLACAPAPSGPVAPGAADWSVTAWGSGYEIFPEVGPLIAGEATVAHTHVTRLDGFEPLAEGRVELVLAGPDGEEVFAGEAPSLPGIFAIEIRPAAAGERDLLFRIDAGAGAEVIRGGRVRIGTSTDPGGVVVAPAPKGASDGGEPLTFLKEEQWRSDFATTWVRRGTLERSLSGLARVRPQAGGETTLTAPVDGVVQATGGAGSWPYAGLRVGRDAPLLRLLPHLALGRSLEALEAELATLAAERDQARARLGRLEELLRLEATSRREVEETAARVAALDARHAAAERDLETARASREGKRAAGGLLLRAPFAGQVAAVMAKPGTTVAAGEPLARLVRTDRVWLEVALPPAAAARLGGGVVGAVLTGADGETMRVEQDLALVAVAPELSPESGTVTALLELVPRSPLTLGTTLEAQLLLAERREGVVIPASALIDDGGVPVVFLQLSGERFVRQVVEVVERQGDRLLIDGLVPGQRLVARGGAAIRRSSLLGSGQAHGHVH